MFRLLLDAHRRRAPGFDVLQRIKNTLIEIRARTRSPLRKYAFVVCLDEAQFLFEKRHRQFPSPRGSKNWGLFTIVVSTLVSIPGIAVLAAGTALRLQLASAAVRSGHNSGNALQLAVDPASADEITIVHFHRYNTIKMLYDYVTTAFGLQIRGFTAEDTPWAIFLGRPRFITLFLSNFIAFQATPEQQSELDALQANDHEEQWRQRCTSIALWVLDVTVTQLTALSPAANGIAPPTSRSLCDSFLRIFDGDAIDKALVPLKLVPLEQRIQCERLVVNSAEAGAARVPVGVLELLEMLLASYYIFGNRIHFQLESIKRFVDQAICHIDNKGQQLGYAVISEPMVSLRSRRSVVTDQTREEFLFCDRGNCSDCGSAMLCCSGDARCLQLFQLSGKRRLRPPTCSGVQPAFQHLHHQIRHERIAQQRVESWLPHREAHPQGTRPVGLRPGYGSPAGRQQAQTIPSASL